MFYHIEDFTELWENEVKKTLKLFHQLKNEALEQHIDEKGRSLKELANHITHTITEMPHAGGLPITVNEADYSTAQEIVKHYEEEAHQLSRLIRTHWTDKMLLDEVPIYGQLWKRNKLLLELVLHQTHHRAQMTVLMRQAGLKVPGLYGPSREEWAAMNR